MWDRAKAKAEQLLGRAEELYGQSHGDPAATVAGQAHQVEAEAELEEPADPPRDDDGLAGAR